MSRKLFARLHQNGEDLVVRVDFDERELRMRAKPKIFHITDHYANHEMMLVRLSAVAEGDLKELLEGSWRRCASKRLLARLDAA